MMVKGKNILITGGGGFIGTALAENLAENNMVTLLDTSFENNAISYSSIATHKNVTKKVIDILDKDALLKVTEKMQIVIHLAAKLGVQHVLKNSRETLNVNYIGTSNLLQAVSDNGNCERFIFFSTSEVFGSNAYKIIENGDSILKSMESTRWCYSVSKLAAEHLAFSYYRETNLPVVVIRPFNVFGPQRVGDNVTRRFILNAINNDDLIVYGDGTSIRAWCYIDDFCGAVLNSLERKEAIGEAFNIGNARNTMTAYNLASKIVELSGSKSKIVFKKIDFRDIDIRVPDISKAERLLGYQPTVTIDVGFRNTIDWYKNNLNKINETIK
jgi:UDP-glucose 4-epimerase